MTARLVDAKLSGGHYNMVDRSYTINQIAQHMQEVFDGLEMVYINQDLQLNHLRVQQNQEISQLAEMPESSLSDDLPVVSKKFRFWVSGSSGV